MTDFKSLAGLRVLLLNMPLRESARPNTPPQGPGILAAILRQYSAEVSLLDWNAYRIKDDLAAGKPNGRWLSEAEATALLERHLNKHGEPDLVGLSGMITTLRWQNFAASVCRQLLPQTTIVSGGGLATEIRGGLFDWIPELDAIVHSEGDEAILELARKVREAKNYHCHKLPPRRVYAGQRPADLDALPFAAWDLLEQDVDGNPILDWYMEVPVWGGAANNSSATSFAMKRSLTTASSRGCPYACAFCYRGAQGERNYGMRSPENLVAEALWLKETYGIDFLGFNDDNFGVDKRRLVRLPEAFRPLQGLPWGTHTRLDEAADERAEWMARAGCVYIGFGAESASPPVLERMKKGGFILRPRGSRTNQLTSINGFAFPTTMVEGIRNCQRLGIHQNCTWIMGYPGETLEDLKTSVAFILWQREQAADPQAVNDKMFTATAYPGTAMFQDPACRELLVRNFGLSFRNDDGAPGINDALRHYVEELDDATKVMHDPSGRPLYYGAMSLDQFMEARAYADRGQIEKIMEM